MLYLTRAGQFTFCTLFSVILLVGCKPPTNNEIGAKVLSTDLKVGSNTLEIETNPNLKDETLQLEANMNMTGHGSPTGVAKRVSAGRYQLEGFEFNMAGDWILSVEAEEDGKVKKADVPIVVK